MPRSTEDSLREIAKRLLIQLEDEAPPGCVGRVATHLFGADFFLFRDLVSEEAAVRR